MADAVQVNLTATEIRLITEALGRAASRHESEARFNPRNAGTHDRKAAHMRELRVRLAVEFVRATEVT
jgi:hypothetical protein